ncbi:MAG: PAS domain-containing protein [Micropepsaceae bacterium]
MLPVAHPKTEDVAPRAGTLADVCGATLELIDLAAALVSEQGAIVFVNGAWRQAAGAGFPAANGGGSFLEALDAAAANERSYETLAGTIRSVLAAERNSAKLELRLRIAGERRWLQAVVKRCGDGCLVTLDDQTAARASYSSMVEVTRVLRTVLDNTPHCMFWLDKLGCIEGANQPFFDDSGLAGIVGKTISELDWEGALAAFFRDTVLRVAADGVKVRSILEAPTRNDAPPRWIDASVDPLVSGDGTVLGFVCAYADVSGVKAQEKLLHLTKSSIDRAGQPLLWLRPDGTIAYGNEAAADLCGYREAELREADLFRLQDRITPDAWRERWAAADTSVWAVKLDLISKAGARIPVEFLANRIEHEGDKYCSVHVRDLREHAALMETARDAEERLRITLESAGVGTFDWDVPTGRITNDERCAAMLFYEPGNIAQRIEAWAALVHPDDLPAGKQAVKAHFAGKTERYFYQRRMRAKDRSWRWMHETGRVVERDAGGKPLRVLGVMVDVTDMERAREDLRSTARRLSLAKDTARIGIWEFDYRTGLTTWDDRMFELYGGTRLTLNPHKWDRLVHPDDRAAVLHEVVTHPKEGRPFSANYRIVKRDGTIAYMQARGYLEFASDGKLVRELGIVQDVTEEARRRQALEQSEKLQAVGTLAAGVAHEFNNILSIISGFADLARSALRRGDATPDQLDQVIEAAARGAKLTKGMLAFSRKSPARDASTFDLRDLAQEQTLFLKPLVGPAYELKVTSGDIAAVLDAERDGVAQCLMNLVVNARDAMTHGGSISIAVDVVDAHAVTSRLGPAPKVGKFVRLQVADNGAGMTAATLQRIFEPFFTTKDVGKGTGLGLAYVYGFMKEASGHLDVMSEPGQGTTFCLFFPLAQSRVSDLEHAIGATTSHFDGKTVLLIDDEPGLVQIYKAMLEELGFRVVATTDTYEGLSLADEHPGKIDLILSDILMPQIPGPRFVELAQSLRPEAKAVFMTGQQQRGTKTAAVLPEGVPVLDKPFTISDLSAAISTVFAEERAAVKASA